MRSRILISGGRLVELPAGDVLVEDGRIVAVAPSIAADDAEVIDATGKIVLPGFVDTHRHTWQTIVRHRGADWSIADYQRDMFARVGPRVRPEDIHAGALLAALAALDSGITTLLDWSHAQTSPAHADAAIDALEESGIRAVFAHGWPCDDPARWLRNSTLPHPPDLRRIRKERLSRDDARVTLAMAARGPISTSMDVARADFALARELGLRITMHVFGDPAPGRIEALAIEKLLGPDLTIVHATGVDDAGMKIMADHGVSASVAPQIELSMAGLGRPVLDRLLAAGVRTSLSVDSETAAAADMFTQMRAARAVSSLGARELLDLATVGGAHALGLGKKIATLAAGMEADIVLLRATDVNLVPLTAAAEAIVLGAHPGNVDTVLVGGVVVKRDGGLLADLGRASRLACASQQRLLGG